MKTTVRHIDTAAFLQIPVRAMEHKHTAYFKYFTDARNHGQKHGAGFPNWRVVNYDRGWAVQAYISGPYFNLAGELK